MRQYIVVAIKLLGILFLIYALYAIFSLIPMVYYDFHSSYGYKYTALHMLLPISMTFIFFYLCMYKTDSIIRFFRLDEKLEPESTIPFSRHGIFKTGVFLIGFYLFASNIPYVLVQSIQWLISELTLVNENSLDRLLHLFDPFNPESLLYSLSYSFAGFVIALKHSKVASYFLKEEKDR